ncbi:nucleotidyl transferase AbiEii/AbiGii toxin family protein [Proteiniclasticum sp. SCR006]|uniref:Nucleotidyl transferase AbiEii/AbiGii toxin family protein n=1 Tax=Proteiniclasticum aestuarii TaxID=2817862 RepID=A0A939KHA8_9CLOT|nr:nucleotidyl transferase AbiEii/AbiGii toxin family protein [Proteiniclasticum aestuarii]MBO1265274.1 nucleotidyl transferase AbiEii/AbiGii toxin family protein [Proteiniclasticum aestuarii]
MRNPEQLKGVIRNIAKDKNLKPHEVLQMYLFERILERLSLSSYRNNFILKGGLLIASMIGVESRSTLDMDTTVKNILMDDFVIREAVQELIQIDIEDGIEFMYEKMEPIREDDEYKNFRVHLKAVYGKIVAPMKIDITTGEIITPSAIEYSFRLMLEDREIRVMAYNLETILAEKYETIIRRNIGTTRVRDYYDLYMLYRSRISEISRNDFIDAVGNTAKQRGSLELLADWQEICEDIKKEKTLEMLWINYQKENNYAADISFEEVTNNIQEVAQYLNNNDQLQTEDRL